MVCAWNWVKESCANFRFFVSRLLTSHSISIIYQLTLSCCSIYLHSHRESLLLSRKRWSIDLGEDFFVSFFFFFLVAFGALTLTQSQSSISIIRMSMSNSTARATSSRECREEGSHSPMFSSGFNNCARKSPKDGSMSKCCCILIFFVDSGGNWAVRSLYSLARLRIWEKSAENYAPTVTPSCSNAITDFKGSARHLSLSFHRRSAGKAAWKKKARRSDELSGGPLSKPRNLRGKIANAFEINTEDPLNPKLRHPFMMYCEQLSAINLAPSRIEFERLVEKGLATD